MKFCTKCGDKLVNDTCPKYSVPKNNTKEKNFDSKNKRILSISILIIILLISIFFFFGKSKVATMPEVASIFLNSIINKNTDDLQKILYSSDERLSINTENSIVLIDYFANNPSDFTAIQENFKTGNFISDQLPLSIKEVDKKFLFFPVYKVVVKPTFIKIDTDFKDSKVKISTITYNNLTLKNEIGPLMPGEYNLTAELSNSYLNKSEVISVDTYNSNNESIKLFKDLIYVNINSDIPNADLYVNDKDTGIKVKDAAKFGPLEPNSTIHAIATKDGKRLISNKYFTEHSSNIFISFNDVKFQEDEFKISLSNLLYNYASNFAYAVNYNDFSYISPYIELGSPLYSMQKSAISKFYSENISEAFEDIEILNYTFNNDTNEGEVSCSEVYYIAKGNNVPKRQEFKMTYTFKRLFNGTLILTDIKS